MRAVVGCTLSFQHNKISIGASRALFQSRHPLNQGITVIQLLDNSISFYLASVSLIQAEHQGRHVIKIDSAVVCADLSFLRVSD